jgi:S-layer homology domain
MRSSRRFTFLLALAAIPSEAQQIFGDVSPSSPYYNTANMMYQLGITIGCGTDPNLQPPLKFCPNDTIPRWQMAVFVIRAVMGNDNFSYTATPYFTDVSPDLYYFKHIQKMKDLGITAGCSATTFCPDDPTLGYMAAVFTIRAAQRKPQNPLYITSDSGLPLDNTFETYSPTPWFTDVDGNHQYFRFIQKMLISE